MLTSSRTIGIGTILALGAVLASGRTLLVCRLLLDQQPQWSCGQIGVGQSARWSFLIGWKASRVSRIL